MTQKTDELRAQDIKFTTEMESESGKYTELQKFSSQDLQAIEDINAHEADLKNKTESMLSKNQNMVKEIPKLEADLKKAKLVNQNFVQELEVNYQHFIFFAILICFDYLELELYITYSGTQIIKQTSQGKHG
jgi:hypothetical protein